MSGKLKWYMWEATWCYGYGESSPETMRFAAPADMSEALRTACLYPPPPCKNSDPYYLYVLVGLRRSHHLSGWWQAVHYGPNVATVEEQAQAEIAELLGE